MPGNGGGGGTVNTTSTTQTNMGPWDVQQDYLKNAFKQADTIMSGNRATYYPGSTVSPFNAAQNTGYNQIIDRAGNNPLFPAAQKSYLDTVNGSYLDPSSNPYLKQTFDAAAGAVSDQYKNITAPTTDALFASNGPISGGARQNAINLNNAGLGRTLDNLATSIYGGNYQQERGRQDAATGNVGSMIQSGYLDPTAMVNAGGAQQAQSQKELTDQVNSWMAQYSDQAQWDRLAKYMGIVGGNNWGQSGTSTTTQQQPYSSNPMMQGIGGLLGAGSVAGQLGWSPFGAAGAAGMAGEGATLGMEAASIAPMMISDERMKTDIERVGVDEATGLTMYAYRYKGDPQTYPKVVGPMAQEIEAKYPHAVHEVAGRKVVDVSFMRQFFVGVAG